MSFAGFTWFLGTVFEPALFLHRGPLVHLQLSYPTGRLPTRLARGVVAVAYVDAAIEPVAQNDAVTLALERRRRTDRRPGVRGTSGPARKAGGPRWRRRSRLPACSPATAIGRAVGWDDTAMLLDLRRRDRLGRAAPARRPATGAAGPTPSSRASCVDLGAARGAGTLRSHARGRARRPVARRRLPAAGNRRARRRQRRARRPPAAVARGRTVTPIDDARRAARGARPRRRAPRRPALSSSPSPPRRGLRSRTRACRPRRAHGRRSSRRPRRRIVEAADAQRRRLEEELRLGAARRLETVAALLAEARAGVAAGEATSIATLDAELGDARRELQEFAHGVQPAALTEGGLDAGADRCSPTTLGRSGRRAGRDRQAARRRSRRRSTSSARRRSPTPPSTPAATRVDDRGERASRDASPSRSPTTASAARTRSRGSGLRGLADRVEALGGRLDVGQPEPGARNAGRRRSSRSAASGPASAGLARSARPEPDARVAGKRAACRGRRSRCTRSSCAGRARIGGARAHREPEDVARDRVRARDGGAGRRGTPSARPSARACPAPHRSPPPLRGARAASIASRLTVLCQSPSSAAAAAVPEHRGGSASSWDPAARSLADLAISRCVCRVALERGVDGLDRRVQRASADRRSGREPVGTCGRR